MPGGTLSHRPLSDTPAMPVSGEAPRFSSTRPCSGRATPSPLPAHPRSHPVVCLLVSFAYLLLFPAIRLSFLHPTRTHNPMRCSHSPLWGPSRASCPTERDSRSPASPAVPGLRTQVHGEARSGVLLFWAQPGQEETKGGSPPFPGVPRVFPTISWCPDVSLSSQKHLSNSLFACKAPVQQLLGE